MTLLDKDGQLYLGTTNAVGNGIPDLNTKLFLTNLPILTRKAFLKHFRIQPSSFYLPPASVSSISIEHARPIWDTQWFRSLLMPIPRDEDLCQLRSTLCSKCEKQNPSCQNFLAVVTLLSWYPLQYFSQYKYTYLLNPRQLLPNVRKSSNSQYTHPSTDSIPTHVKMICEQNMRTPSPFNWYPFTILWMFKCIHEPRILISRGNDNELEHIDSWLTQAVCNLAPSTASWIVLTPLINKLPNLSNWSYHVVESKKKSATLSKVHATIKPNSTDKKCEIPTQFMVHIGCGLSILKKF